MGPWQDVRTAGSAMRKDEKGTPMFKITTAIATASTMGDGMGIYAYGSIAFGALRGYRD